MASAEEILEYWFGSHTDPSAVNESMSKLWWGKSPETDRDCEERFGATLAQASAGELDAWSAEPASCTALIIVLDQLTRMLHRDTARMYENDARALALTTRMIDSGQDARVPAIRRVFIYMPLMHAESVEAQDRGVDVYAKLAEAVPESAREPFTKFHGYMVLHRDIVARFGRFPHRNGILGRDSTPEELEFLQQPNSSF